MFLIVTFKKHFSVSQHLVESGATDLQTVGNLGCADALSMQRANGLAAHAWLATKLKALGLRFQPPLIGAFQDPMRYSREK